MRRIGRLAVALVVLATVAVATPARADNLNASCSTWNGDYYMNAWTYYTPTGPYHHWYMIQYELGGHPTGGKSNVNFAVVETTGVRYGNNSPDSLHSYQLYTVTPPGQVLTSQVNEEWVRFEAIFDKWLEDPRCPAQTAHL